MPLKTDTDFVKLVENRLGWVNPRPGPDWRRYQHIATRVAARRAQTGATLADLELAVALLAREKIARSPLGVFAHVERARELAREAEHDIDAAITEAMRQEELRGDPDDWATRFARAHGSYRQELYDRWNQTSRGRD